MVLPVVGSFVASFGVDDDGFARLYVAGKKGRQKAGNWRACRGSATKPFSFRHEVLS